MANEAVQKYFDSLLQSYDLMVDAASKANERGTKVSRQFLDDVITGQREAIALGKKLAAEPSDVGVLYQSLLESATAAQGRVLGFTQLAYQEALSAGTDSRDVIEKLTAAARETAQAAMEAGRSFGASAPWADAMKKNWESMLSATGTKTKS